MKKLVLVVIIIMILPSIVFAEAATIKGEYTTSQVVCSNRCVISSIIVTADAANQATAVLYDIGSASTSNKIVSIIVPAGQTLNGATFGASGWQTKYGLYVTISGTGAAYTVGVEGGN